MPLVQNDVMRLAIFGTVSGEEMANVIHMRVKNAAGVANPQAGLASIALAWANAWDNEQSNVYSWTRWSALQVGGAGVTYSAANGKRSGGQTFQADLSPAVVGDLAVDMLPPGVAFVLSLRTGFSGKSKRGRVYIPGMAEGHNSGGAPTAAAVLAVQTIANTWLGVYGAAGVDPDWTMGVWSERTATDRFVVPGTTKTVQFGGNPQPALAFTPIATAIADTQWGSARSRSFLT
jgi:hypothetical protein